MGCIKCNNKSNEVPDNAVVCVACGASRIVDLIQSINKQENSFRKAYRSCIDALKEFQKQCKPDPSVTTYKPNHPVNLKFIDSLPKWETVSPLGTVAFALSVSRHRMECFYQIKLLDSDKTLGELINAEILGKIDQFGPLQSLLFGLDTPFLPRAQVSSIVTEELAFL